MPVYLRWRKGDAFKQGAWNLGNKWRWLNPIAVGWVIITPLVLGVLFVAISLAWVLGMNKRYTGPIRTIEFDEGLGIKEIDEPPESEPPAATPPATPA